MPHTPDQRKVYNRTKRLARQALEAGVPTAKIVSMLAPMVGRSTAYEMLRGADRGGRRR